MNSNMCYNRNNTSYVKKGINMKRIATILLALSMLLCGCSTAAVRETAAATEAVSKAVTDATTETDAVQTDAVSDAQTEDKPPVSTPDPDNENDTPEYTDDDYIRTPADVKLEMYSADFWTDDKYNEIIMTPQEIERYNSKRAAELGNASIGYYTIDTVPGTVSYDFVRAFVQNYIPVGYQNYRVGGEAKKYSWWTGVLENTNVSGIPSSSKVKYGYSVLYSTLRDYPVAEFMTNNADNQLDDLGAKGALRPYDKVIVIHESADGKWYYALTDCASGWVKKEEVAFCKSRSDWNNRSDPESFLVITGHEIRLTYENLAPEYSGLLLPMGTVLTLVRAEDAPEYVNDRLTYGNYVVLLPTRGSDGYIKDRYALIPYGSDVHIGYLDYTRNNVLELAFKYVGHIYGFKGIFYSVNCSGLTQSVFSCFGLQLAGLATNQQRASFELERIVLEDMSIAQKKAVLDKVDAGTILFFDEHVMIYLGEHDGEYYCISATAGFHGVEGGEGTAPFLYNVSVNTLEVHRHTGLSWFEELWSIQLVRYEK